MKSYREAGVDVELGLRASELFFRTARRSWEYWPWRDLFHIEGQFDGACYIRPRAGLPSPLLCGLSLDGVGTKVEIAESLGKYDTIAYDLLAMICDDCAVKGVVPVGVGTILDLSRLRGEEGDFLPHLEELASGLLGAAREAGVAVMGGEIAELGSKVGGEREFKFNWGGTALWFAPAEKLFRPEGLKPGTPIVALREDGFRSNGLTLARKVFSEVLGPEWYRKPWGDSILGLEALRPSRIYSRFINWLNGDLFDTPKVPIISALHVTGGGLIGRLNRHLKPWGLGASISRPMEIPPVIKFCQELGNIDNYEAYSTWNMGCGVLLFSEGAEEIISRAEEWGVKAAVIGEVTSSPGVSVRNLS